MPKKIVKDQATQFAELQERNNAMEAMAYRLWQLARKQSKQLEDMPTSEPPKVA